VHPVGANEVFDALYLIRNTLAHVDRLLAPHSPTEVVLLIDVADLGHPGDVQELYRYLMAAAFRREQTH